MKPDDIVELPDGRRLMVISPERAAQIYKDVQMWYFRGHTWEKDQGVPEARDHVRGDRRQGNMLNLLKELFHEKT